jgi:hypothetical protein
MVGQVFQAQFSTRPQRLARIAGLFVLVTTLAGCGVATADQAAVVPTTVPDIFDPAVPNATPIPGVETFNIPSAKHTTEPVDYPQDPPVGGPHDPSWQRCGVYSAPIKPEHAVHSMEHGAVWITYRPDLPSADVAYLTSLVAGKRYILLSPYPGLADPVVASAWGAQLRLPDPRDPRLEDFVARYAGHGPEPGANCDAGVESTLPT